MTTENETPAELPAYKSALLEDVEEAMRDVVDPELGVNVVDLGLVYDIDALADGIRAAQKFVGTV